MADNAHSNNSPKLRPFVNPYNFVPFGGTMKEDGHKKSREEVYLGSETLFSGWADVSLVTKTPLIIPDGANPEYYDFSADKIVYKPNEAEKRNLHKRYSFFRIPVDGKKIPAIPGSELRGLVRSIYEAVSDSCVPVLMNDKPISQRVPLYGSLQRRGLLGFDKGTSRWVLYGTKNTRRKVTFAENGFDLLFENGEKVKNKPGDFIPGKGYVQYSRPVDKSKAYFINYLQKNDVQYEWSVGNDIAYKNMRSALKRDGVTKSIKNLNQDISGSLLSALENANNGEGNLVPVWYFKVHDEENKEIVYMSPSSIGRIAQRRKWEEIMGEYKPCSDTSKLCPACLLFGTIKGKGLKGHVRFSDALPVGTNVETERHTLQILAEPRTSAFDFYLRRPPKALYWNFDFYGVKTGTDPKAPIEYRHLSEATPCGRKMYWHSSVATDEKPSKMNSTMEAVKPETEFTYRLFFDRITENQLKGLLWTISLGDNKADSSLMQKLGHAKPLGYGSIKMVVTDCVLRKISESGYNLEKYSLDPLVCPFEKTESIDALLAMCDIRKTEGMEVRYPRLVKKGKDDIFNWFANNHMNQQRLVTLPEPTDADITLKGSWLSPEVNSPCIKTEDSTEICVGAVVVVEVRAEKINRDTKKPDLFSSLITKGEWSGRIFNIPEKRTGKMKIRITKINSDENRFFANFESWEE